MNYSPVRKIKCQVNDFCIDHHHHHHHHHFSKILKVFLIISAKKYINQKGHFHKAHWKSGASCGQLIHFLMTFSPKTAFFFTMTGTLTMKENVQDEGMFKLFETMKLQMKSAM